MAVDVDLGPRANAFRREVREWLEANPVPRDASGRVDQRAWAELNRQQGYVCVGWPKEYGGGGLGGVEVAILNEEFARARAPRVNRGMGEGLVGPSIISWGTDEQKAYFLPRIIDGTDRYCQGFSEPDAGSDLAALKTRGDIDGDEVVITGQKVWTSWYWNATMVFCLCRTDPEAEKHAGISYVLVPVKRDDGEPNGVEFRPLRQITGEAHFAETFLTEARAPIFNVIGGLHNGWRSTKTTLANERGGSATTQHLTHRADFHQLVDAARSAGRTSDPLVRQHLAWAYTHVELMRFSGLRLLANLAAGHDPGPASSINKMFWSEYQRHNSAVAMNIVGPESLVFGESGHGYRPNRWAAAFLGARSHTIWGGTAEIQRNIVGERVLGLPREPGLEG